MLVRDLLLQVECLNSTIEIQRQRIDKLELKLHQANEVNRTYAVYLEKKSAPSC
jgi:hypothetical protein